MAETPLQDRLGQTLGEAARFRGLCGVFGRKKRGLVSDDLMGGFMMILQYTMGFQRFKENFLFDGISSRFVGILIGIWIITWKWCIPQNCCSRGEMIINQWFCVVYPIFRTHIWIVPGYKWTNLPQLLLGLLSVANYQVEAELIQTLKTLKELCYCFGRPRRARNRLDTNTLRFYKVLEDPWSEVLKLQWKCMWTSTVNYICKKKTMVDCV